MIAAVHECICIQACFNAMKQCSKITSILMMNASRCRSWLLLLLLAQHTQHFAHGEPITTPSIPTSDCGIPLPDSCSCSPSDKEVSFSCFEAGLTAVPKIYVGAKVIKTLNLGKNRLTTIKMGDFYGLKITRLLLSNNSLSELPLLAFWGLESLETLDLSFNRLTTVPADALKLLLNLRSLVLTANRITMLRHYDFGYLRHLEVLALDRNPVQSVANTAFVGTHLSLLKLDQVGLQQGLRELPTKSLKNLQGLTLSGNGIRVIPKLWFQGLESLQYIRLDNNYLKFIPNDTFTGIEGSLRTLEVNNNNLLFLPIVTIRKLTSLEDLLLAGNRLRKIINGSFNNSRLLKTLDLSYNFISSISAFAFHGLDNVRRIDLRFNHLYTLDDRTLYWPMPADRQIFLAHNPWLCNCQIRWMKHDYKRKAERFKIVQDREKMLCERPHFYRGRPITRLFQREFTCTHDYFIYYFYDDPVQEVSSDFSDDEDDPVQDGRVNDDDGSAEWSGSGYSHEDDTERGGDDYEGEISISSF